MDAVRLAKMLDITDRQVRNHAKSGLFEKVGRGRYNVDDCVRAYIRYLKEQKQGDVESLTNQRIRLTQAQADRTQLELEIMKEKNVPIELCQNFWISILSAVRSKVLSISNSLKIKYPHIENEVIITIDEISRSILDEASKSGIPPSLSRHLAQYVSSSASAKKIDGE